MNFFQNLDDRKKLKKMKASVSRRDVYKKTAVEEGWRARSAYKLIQVESEMHFLKDSTRVVDLCSAPGSWSQVCAKLMPETDARKIISIDLRRIVPIDGVTELRGDITDVKTAENVISLLDGNKADGVLADGAPDTIIRIEFDEYVQHNIVKASLAIATMVLREGGTFVSKIFRTKSLPKLLAIFGCFFSKITMCKPRACRLSSVESFIVCQGFKLPDGYTPTLCTDDLPTGPVPEVPFRMCGDVDGLDSERTYPLSNDQIEQEIE